MTPADEVLLLVLEWLEPENVTRLNRDIERTPQADGSS